ncbi:MAG TPA: ABC transporter permease [Vicinamibacterales bacterium]|nr:ABC transporter permease [Vicinamibacterales bacterium]
MDTLRLDLAYTLRTWRRQPGTTAAAILALALGIGANTTVFSFVAGVLLRPLPYADPDRLVMVWQDRSAKGGPNREVISPGLFVDWTTRASTLEGVAAIRNWSPNLTGNDQPERLTGATVSGAYFSTLGIPPAWGRTFSADDDRYGAPTVVVLSHTLWQRRFAADPAIVGRSIQLDGQPVEVIGVMPASFRGAVVDAEIWNTMRVDTANAPRGIIMLRALARLAPGVSFEQAQLAMTTLHGQLEQEDPELVGARTRLIRLHDDMVGAVRPVLLVLAGSVAMVLLIACANVASLLMARASQRRAEMSVRAALGADRRRLVQQLLAESGLLALAGCVCGLGLAWFGVQALIAAAPPQSPRLLDVRLDLGVLAFTAAITVFAAVVAGLVPAIAASRVSLVAGLREGARDVPGLTRSRSLLVAAEVAAAMTLVIGAGLFVRSLVGLQNVDLGFKPDQLLTASVSPPRGAYRGEEALAALFDRMIARASQLPGVELASFTSILPLSGAQINFNFRIKGRPPGRAPGDEPVASFRSVGQTFFSTMGMTVLEGRGFLPDDRAGAPAVAVVNQALVKRYWSGVSPIGQEVGVNGQAVTIVGVAADVHHTGPAAVPEGEMYMPYAQLSARGGWLVLRTKGDPSSLVPALRLAMREIDPNLPLASVRPMSALVAGSVAQPRFLATLLTWFSATAVVLALVGVYGLLAFAVSQRVREIGLRMALGASRAAVVLLILRQSLGVVLAGVVAGACAGAALSQVLKSFLFGVAPGDPATIATMAAFILLAALAASCVPALRASRIDPVVALRDD